MFGFKKWVIEIICFAILGGTLVYAAYKEHKEKEQSELVEVVR